MEQNLRAISVSECTSKCSQLQGKIIDDYHYGSFICHERLHGCRKGFEISSRAPPFRILIQRIHQALRHLPPLSTAIAEDPCYLLELHCSQLMLGRAVVCITGLHQQRCVVHPPVVDINTCASKLLAWACNSPDLELLLKKDRHMRLPDDVTESKIGKRLGAACCTGEDTV